MCCMLSCFSPVQLFATPWTVALQAPLSMGFSRQEYWNGLSCSSPANLPNTRTEPTSLKLPSLAGKFFTTSTTWEAIFFLCDSFDPNSFGAWGFLFSSYGGGNGISDDRIQGHMPCKSLIFLVDKVDLCYLLWNIITDLTLKSRT